MMREILFRGKRIDNGEWVQGYAYQIWESVYILWGMTNGVPNMIEVIPETVGQYTGLTDKNGTKIFEGDIVNVFTETTRYVVKFDEWRCGWYPFASGDGCGCCETHTHPPNYAEVIGNIHDTPELMEGGSE